jgi:uncharacterized protein YcbK (DUF882 family)
LRDALDQFRELSGKPVIIDDAYRCPIHNAQVGGVPHSQHVEGNAADIRIPGLTAADLYQIALRVPSIHGIGRADHQDYLHVDVRPAPARWCYSVSGREIAWYDPEQAGIAA